MIIILYCCVALLSPIVFGKPSDDSDFRWSSSDTDDFEEVALNDVRIKVGQVIQNKSLINNVFRPLRFLGRGGFSETYEGVLLRNSQILTVAMKFSPIVMMGEEDILNEYEIYTYLNAIDNSSVEQYGIPAVYYYGEWESCKLLAITLLDSRFNELRKLPEKRFTDIDLFIILREYVRISKYIHSRGVCQIDAYVDNIMFRKSRGFLIDFNISRKITDVIDQGDCRKRDLESFIISMCELMGMTIIQDITHDQLMRLISTIPHKGLKKVYVYFARFATGDGPIPYDRMHKMITDEIIKSGMQEPVHVSWLTNAEKNEPLTRVPTIRSIADSYSITEFNYPTPNFEYFVAQ